MNIESILKEAETTILKLGKPTVYVSELLNERFHETCNQLFAILERRGIAHAFIKGSKDIWCRDYMPVQTPSGRLIQFKYSPSYLNDPKYADSRTDVATVCRENGFKPQVSDINIDGGNVVMYDNKAIITDRVFSENPEINKEDLKKRLSELLECEIIIIPAYKETYDFTGHADGMMRFVDNETVLVNNLNEEFKYVKDLITKSLKAANLQYINFPFLDYKDKKYPENAIGIYINYLEVGDLIIMPTFNVEGNRNEEALAILKKQFPGKTIETIDYTEVAKQGGVINCTTWVCYS